MLHALWLPEITIRQEQAANPRCFHYERGALQTLVTHALSLMLAGEDIRMRARRRER